MTGEGDVRFSRRSDKAEALKDIPLFRNLSEHDRDVLAAHVDEVEVDAGTELTHQDAHGTQVVLIVEGAATVVRDGSQLADLGPGDVVGEMALIDGERGTATVTTTEPSVLLVMSSQDFNTVLEESPAFARKIMKQLVQRLRVADTRLVG
jgi:CRP/FNR family transcriptional regulator, cyclic AMP receptor protein